MIKEELILQYLDKTISAEDAVLVQDWAAENPMDFSLMQAIWGVDSSASEIQLFDTNDAWDSFMDALDVNSSQDPALEQKVKRDLSATTDNEIDSPKKVVFWKGWGLAVTAAVFLLAAIAIYFLWPRNQEITYYAENAAGKVTLPDQTIVTLEEGSAIKYFESFENKEKRVVSLQGIGVFEVASDPSKPFVVETGSMGVKALGTIFEVDAIDSVQTGVKNIEGLIRFFELADQNTFVDVKEGESFLYDGTGFKETTPIEPRILYFAPPPVPYHTVREIVDYISALSKGNTIAKGDAFDWEKEVQVDLTIEDLDTLLQILNKKASLTLLKKDCSECYEILRFRVR